MTESNTDIAFDLVNEIVNGSFESAQKPTVHTGSRVTKKTFEEWTVRFPWLILNNNKEQMTLSCKICHEQRDTLTFKPSVQMSGLCRHSESYKHKNASRETY